MAEVRRHGAPVKARMKNLRTNEQMELQYNPEHLPYKRGVRFNQIQGAGSSYPKFQYCGGDEGVFSLTLLLDGTCGQENLVKTQMDFLKSLLPPADSNSAFAPPPVCVFIMGKDIRKCILQGYEDDIMEFTDDLLPRLVTVNLEFKEVK